MGSLIEISRRDERTLGFEKDDILISSTAVLGLYLIRHGLFVPCYTFNFFVGTEISFRMGWVAVAVGFLVYGVRDGYLVY